MTVTEVKQALGSFSLRLRPETPREILDALTPYGHVAIVSGQLDVAQYGDGLLTAARYVGVYRARSNNPNERVELTGSGMSFWLGDEDGKGDVFETPVVLTAATFAASVAALLPPGGSITAGTINAVAGTYSGTHQWETPRHALDYLTSIFGAEWQVTGDGKLNAGTVAQLYVTNPTAILVRNQEGRELGRVGLPGTMQLDRDVVDYTTRVVLLGEGDGAAIVTASANAVGVPYKDIHANTARFTRLVSESGTEAANASARAQLALNQFTSVRSSISLSTDYYDAAGEFRVGDYIDVYDADSGFTDPAREVYWRGIPVNPVSLRVVEMTWPIPPQWTVGFRDINGAWIDLSPYYFGETGQTTITVGTFSSSLSGIGGEDVGTRVSVDTSIPAAPVFGAFSIGSYQSVSTNTTKSVIQATWSTPLNLDGSTVLDGDHYEIQYRVSQFLGYSVKWGDLAAFKWGALSGSKWGAPVTNPVDLSPQWQNAIVGWGTNTVTLLELTPGVTYEIQIRGVDGANPPHNGPWSASSFVTTSGDLFPPSVPAAPVVAGSRIAIEVTHLLGKNSGGTFNLEQDLDHLEVHVGGSDSFLPTPDSMVGKLIASAANLGAHIPVVGTFNVEQADLVYVKVVAVDRSGNKSGASPSATVTALLIDNAHISDLSVSKLTAGVITAQSVLASDIEVGTGGSITLTDGKVITKDVAGHTIMESGKTTGGLYGVRVNDAAGVQQVQMGQLSDGRYGLAAVNASGQLVPLARLAFGLSYNTVAPTEDCPSGTYTDITTVGPILTGVEVGDLGVMLVMISSTIIVGNQDGIPTDQSGLMSFDVINSLGTVVAAASDSRCLQISWGGYSGTNPPGIVRLTFNMAASTIVAVTGLAPGVYRLVAKYRSGGTGSCKFASRSLLALPY